MDYTPEEYQRAEEDAAQAIDEERQMLENDGICPDCGGDYKLTSRADGPDDFEPVLVCVECGTTVD